MRKFRLFIIIAMFIVLVNQIYAKDIERLGGIRIGVGPFSTESVEAIAQFLIRDPLGRQTGLDISTGSILEEIPNTDYADDGISGERWVSYLYTPENGTYEVSVIGTGSGRYSLSVFGYDMKEIPSTQEKIGTTYHGKIDNYEITYSSDPSSQVQVKFTGSSEIPVFDGKGQKPTDVNKFLQYFNPNQARTELPAGTNSFNLSIIYGNTIKRETFNAELNGNNITTKFDPLPGKLEIVKIPLIQGTNTLILSIKGVRTDEKIAEDTDRLVFIVP
ncbi:MAG: hypothetical protein QMD01_00985 [Thermodesulfovibrionales bacterium]|nr:hypothetical protein [Thermodesulfovibrionales bacterium]